MFVTSTNYWASMVTQMVKNLPSMWEIWVRPSGLEDPLEKGMVTHSSIFAWRIHGQKTGGAQSNTEIWGLSNYYC